MEPAPKEDSPSFWQFQWDIEYNTVCYYITETLRVTKTIGILCLLLLNKWIVQLMFSSPSFRAITKATLSCSSTNHWIWVSVNLSSGQIIDALHVSFNKNWSQRAAKKYLTILRSLLFSTLQEYFNHVPFSYMYFFLSWMSFPFYKQRTFSEPCQIHKVLISAYNQPQFGFQTSQELNDKTQVHQRHFNNSTRQNFKAIKMTWALRTSINVQNSNDSISLIVITLRWPYTIFLFFLKFCFLICFHLGEKLMWR